MRIVRDFEEGLAALEGQEALWLLLEDWNRGAELHRGLDGAAARARLEEAARRYGPRFSFRAFGPELDLLWEGEFGVLCQGEPGKTRRLLSLETDHRRHPGLAAFRAAAPRDRPFSWVEVEEIRGQQGNHLRLVDLK